MTGTDLLKATWRPGVALAAIAGTALPSVMLFSIGLVLEESYLVAVGFPVAGLLAGTLGALCAAWAANALAPDRSRTRLAPVLLWTAVASLVGIAALLVAFVVGRRLLDGPFATLLLPFILLVPLAATLASISHRRPRSPLRRDALATLAVVALVPVALYGVVGLGCLLDRCGA